MSNLKIIMPAAWIVSLVIIAVISVDYSGAATHFFGIADDQEQTIRFPISVRISNFSFVSGQVVKRGDRLVEVESPELDAELEAVAEQLISAQLSKAEVRSTMQAQLQELKSGLVAQTSELDVQIRKLSTKRRSTKKLLAELENKNVGAELTREISQLVVQKGAVSNRANALILDIESKLQASQRPIDSRIEELQNRISDIEKRRKDLQVHAQFDGEVGSILFKEYEIVAPYQPILTVHGARPSFIRGYIHESVLNDVKENQKVWISSVISSREGTFEGQVKSLGSRIVAFPERLKINPLAPAWGREVIVQIKDQHSLLLGERVEIALRAPLANRLPFRDTLTDDTPNDTMVLSPEKDSE